MSYRSPCRTFLVLVLVLGMLMPLLGFPKTHHPQTRTLLVRSVRVAPCLLRYPKNYQTDQKTDLLVILHGNGGNAASFARIWDDFVNPSFMMAVPQGAYVYSESNKKGHSMCSWYYMTDDRTIWKMADPLAEESIMQVIKAVKAAHSIKRVFILGFSQGASLAYSVGIKNHGQVDGIIALAGIFPQESLSRDQVAVAHHVPVFMARGTHDARVSRGIMSKQRKILRDNGYDLMDLTFRGGHELTPGLLARVQKWMGEVSASGGT